MKAIEISGASPTLTEVLDLASEDNVILRTPEGRKYLLAEIDDFADEVAKVVENPELMQLLNERGRENAHFSLSEVREQLKGKKRRHRK